MFQHRPIDFEAPLRVMMLGLWRDYAACKGQTDLFYPESGQSGREAKAICARCPVAATCLLEALHTGEDDGIRAGLGADRRRRLKRAKGDFRDRYVGGSFRLMRLVEKTIDKLRADDPPEWVTQRNTAGATHGKMSTKNRGCAEGHDGRACPACRTAMSTAGLRRKAARNDDLDADEADEIAAIVAAELLAAP